MGNPSPPHSGRNFPGVAQGPRRGRATSCRRGGVYSACTQATASARTNSNSNSTPTSESGTTSTANGMATRLPPGNTPGSSNTCGRAAFHTGCPVEPRNRRGIGLYPHTCLRYRSHITTDPDRQHQLHSCHRRRRNRLAQSGNCLGNTQSEIPTMKS